MTLMGDGSGSMKDLLPLMMMNGGGQMDPMMMMTLMGDDSGSMKDLLPLMMMNGGGQMDPMMMKKLLNNLKVEKKQVDIRIMNLLLKIMTKTIVHYVEIKKIKSCSSSYFCILV